MNTDEHRLDDALTRSIIGAFFEVANELGCGFLEKPYENALALELRLRGHVVRQQVPMPIVFKGEVVGEYFADMVVDDRVLVEVKAAKGLDEIHVAQCLNYLKASGIRICLLVNFGTPTIKWQRIVR